MNNKSLSSAFLTAIMISGLILVVMRFGTVQASTDESGIPKPAVPEFTLKLEAHPYYVPPTYSIDQYTGENVTIQEGYHVENKSIVVTIKNQPFTPFTDVNVFGISGLFYNISMKGHYGNDWNYYPPAYNVDYLPSSGSNYTVVSFTLGASFREGYFVLGSFPADIPAGGKVDFRVQALIGTYTKSREPWYGMDVYDVKFTGKSSGWSETQTITIGESQTPTPTQEPQQTDQTETIITVAIVVPVIIVGLGLLIYLIKRK